MTDESRDLVALRLALTHFGENKSELARALGTTRQNVNNYSHRGTFPAKSARKVEEITDGKVSAHQVLLENEWIEKSLID